MRNIKLFFSAVILLFILSACQLPFSKNRPAPADVLLASECGQDKLKCCSDEPKCLFGQKCCPDPNDAKRNYCSDECTCGGLDEFCCATAEKCLAGLSCAAGLCIKCGMPGGPCCESGDACLGAGGDSEGATECQRGQCVFCGSDGQSACNRKQKCAGNHLLNNGICYRCGGINQPCCRNEQEEQSCNPAESLVCKLGFCQKPSDSR